MGKFGITNYFSSTILALVFLLKTAHCILSCYECSTYEPTVCNITQRLSPCPYESACLTISYSETIDNVQKFYFQKKCVQLSSIGNDCERNCEFIGSDGAQNKECKASCCSTHACNKEVDESIIWFGLISSASYVSLTQPLSMIIAALTILIIAL